MTIVPPPSSTWCAGAPGLLELLNRQVIDAEHFDALADQMFGAGLGHADVIGVELRRTPQPRIEVLMSTRTSSDRLIRTARPGRCPCGTGSRRPAPGRSAFPAAAGRRRPRRRKNDEARRRGCPRARSCAGRDVRALTARDSLDRFETERGVPGIVWEEASRGTETSMSFMTKAQPQGNADDSTRSRRPRRDDIRLT